MAAYDKNEGKFTSLCKLGTGFTEDLYDQINEKLMKEILKSCPENYEIPKSVKPNYYFKPKEIWEIGYDCFTLSNTYSIGKGIIEDGNQGISVRFPRFIRLRPDKSLKDSNSPEDIISFYKQKL